MSKRIYTVLEIEMVIDWLREAAFKRSEELNAHRRWQGMNRDPNVHHLTGTWQAAEIIRQLQEALTTKISVTPKSTVTTESLVEQLQKIEIIPSTTEQLTEKPRTYSEKKMPGPPKRKKKLENTSPFDSPFNSETSNNENK